MSKRTKRLTLFCLSFSMAAGCASTKEMVFEDTPMKTMEEIYSETKASDTSNVVGGDTEIDLEATLKYSSSISRTSANELDNKFREISNKKLYMFVFPHVTPTNLPVPGYTTSFRMYSKTHFALPGEV